MLRHDVVDISGYQENVIERIRQLQPARLEIPWIISFGEPFAIRIGEASRPAIMGGSFVAGLVAGPALIESGAGAHASASASRRPARAGSSICRCPRSRAAWSGPRTCSGTRSRRCASGWAPNGIGSGALTSLRRFSRAACWPWPGQERPPPGPTRLWRSHGMERIEAIASQLGWSRKHLAARFHDEIGLSPKTIAQMMRFNHALAHARRQTCGWAELAGLCGYADQAHLVRISTASRGARRHGDTGSRSRRRFRGHGLPGNEESPLARAFFHQGWTALTSPPTHPAWPASWTGSLGPSRPAPLPAASGRPR